MRDRLRKRYHRGDQPCCADVLSATSSIWASGGSSPSSTPNSASCRRPSWCRCAAAVRHLRVEEPGLDDVYERYGLGNTRDTRWVSFSVAKSAISMLVGGYSFIRSGSHKVQVMASAKACRDSNVQCGSTFAVRAAEATPRLIHLKMMLRFRFPARSALA